MSQLSRVAFPARQKSKSWRRLRDVMYAEALSSEAMEDVSGRSRLQPSSPGPSVHKGSIRSKPEGSISTDGQSHIRDGRSASLTALQACLSELQIQSTLNKREALRTGIRVKQDGVDFTKMGPRCKIDFDMREFALSGTISFELRPSRLLRGDCTTLQEVTLISKIS